MKAQHDTFEQARTLGADYRPHRGRRRQVATALALFVTVCLGTLQAADPPHLIPFQGHLARPSANDPKQFEPVPAGRYDILFTLYAAPVGGESKVWGPERHAQLTVVNGLVNAMLGSVIGFQDQVAANPNFFARPLYVGITVDADGNPNTADLELVPRQALLPGVYALGAMRADRLDNSDWRDFFVGTDSNGTFTAGTTKARDSEKLDGFDWSNMFGGNGYPTNTILSDRIADSSITGNKIAAQTIPGSALIPATVTSQQIAAGTITAANLHSSLTINSIVPPGTVSAFAGPTNRIPAGWLLCDGRIAASTNYSQLFAAIGKAWGNGSFDLVRNAPENPDLPWTDFNLPDLRGVFLRGANGFCDDPLWRDPEVANRVPRANAVIEDGVGTFQTNGVARHSHPYLDKWPEGNGDPATQWWDNFESGSNDAAYRADHNLVTSQNDGAAEETRPNNAYVNYIIKL